MAILPIPLALIYLDAFQLQRKSQPTFEVIYSLAALPHIILKMLKVLPVLITHQADSMSKTLIVKQLFFTISTDFGSRSLWIYGKSRKMVYVRLDRQCKGLFAGGRGCPHECGY